MPSRKGRPNKRSYRIERLDVRTLNPTQLPKVYQERREAWRAAQQLSRDEPTAWFRVVTVHE